MTKAASRYLGLAFFLATAAMAWSQTSPEQTAINVAIRRQAATIELGNKLTEADEAVARRDLPAAATLFEAAQTLVNEIGDTDKIASERERTRQGLLYTHLELARLAQRRGDLLETKSQLAGALRADPENPTALQMQAANEKTLAEQAGRFPSQQAVEMVAAEHTNKVQAATLIQD